jgi:chlorophyllide a reductase subunit Y
MGPAGAGSLATVINAALANQSRFDEMTSFFEGVGQGDRAGVWQDTPKEHPEFREHTRRQVIKMMKRRKAEELI